MNLNDELWQVYLRESRKQIDEALGGVCNEAIAKLREAAKNGKDEVYMDLFGTVQASLHD